MSNIVYIATSLDGYIADKENKLDWLMETPNPDEDDFGFQAFMDSVDAVVMGRNTLDVVLSFDGPWPYTKPLFVLSNTLTSVPKGYEDKVTIISGEPKQIVPQLKEQGFERLYIDGGRTIQGFMQQDLIDEMIITTIPTVLGGGIPLFGDLEKPVKFKHMKSERFLDCIVKNHFVRQG